MSRFNFDTSIAYASTHRIKQTWHANARAKLRKLALALGLEPKSFDIRSNYAGIAVSGEATLHGDHVYVQVSQPFGGFDTGILYRRCNGRKDYTGGRNHFASLRALHDTEALAAVIERDLGHCGYDPTDDYEPNESGFSLHPVKRDR